MALALPALRAATIGQRASHGRRPSSACGCSTSPQKRPTACSAVTPRSFWAWGFR